jgi:23S rRNA pseudouridine2605 synthase
MCEAVGHPVAELERVAFGPLWLKGLEPGAHRRLTAAEIERLRGAGRPRRTGPPRGAGERARTRR